MFTPQKRAQPSWALQSSGEKANRRDKGKVISPDGRVGGSTPNSTTETLTRTVVERSVVEMSMMDVAPPVASLDGRGPDGVQSEPEIWRRFQEAGALDVESLEKKDRVALLAKVSTLEAEVHLS